MKKKVIFYVVNIDLFFFSHKMPLGMYALKSGYDVYLLAADTSRIKEYDAFRLNSTLEEFSKSGIHFINIPFNRSKINKFNEIKCFFLLVKYSMSTG
jgi:hypothetical protein